jgi:hypothetical protein
MTVDMDKVNVFLVKFVGDMEAAVHSNMMVIGEKLWLHKDTRASGNRVKRRRKRNQTFVQRGRVIFAAVLSCVFFASSGTYSQCTPNDDGRVALELANLGKQGDTIARARRQVLEILQDRNACTAWFQEADPAPAEVFRSLHLALEIKGPSYIYGFKDNEGQLYFKHPWAAESYQHGGRNSVLRLNANGAFFKRASIVMQLDPEGVPLRPTGFRELVISSYAGDTPEAQITILLHELGHIVGRLPADHGSSDDRSTRNTSEVLQHCQAEVRAATRNLHKL